MNSAENKPKSLDQEIQDLIINQIENDRDVLSRLESDLKKLYNMGLL